MFLVALHLQGYHTLHRGHRCHPREQRVALSLTGCATLDKPTFLDLSFLICEMIIVLTSQGCCENRVVEFVKSSVKTIIS